MLTRVLYRIPKVQRRFSSRRAVMQAFSDLDTTASSSHSGVTATATVSDDNAVEEHEGLEVVDNAKAEAAVNQIFQAHQAYAGSANFNEKELTPAQRFYLENKDALIKRAKEYYSVGGVNNGSSNNNDWEFHRDNVAVKRPPRGHLWSVNDGSSNPELGDESEPSEPVELENGMFPSIEKYVEMIVREGAVDVSVVDLEECGRRDIGLWAVTGTVRNSNHGKRIGDLVRSRIAGLSIPNYNGFSKRMPNYDWIVCRTGPVVINLITAKERERYAIEDLYLQPHEYFGNEAFPQYFDAWNRAPPPLFISETSSSPPMRNADVKFLTDSVVAEIAANGK